MCKILRCAFNRMSRCFRRRRFSRTYGFAVALACMMAAVAAHAVTPEKYYDYVQSTNDLYVAIDYTPKGSTVIEAEFTLDKVDANNTIFCSRGKDATTFTLFYISDKTGKYFRWDYSSAGRKSATFNPVAGDRYYARASIAGLFIDGQLAESITGQKEITPNNSMILFGSYPSGSSIAATGNYARMKLHWFKAYDYDENNKLVLSVDLVPAMTNNVVGLYDRKRGTFYSSANSNSLAAGNEITLPTTVSLRTDVIDRGYSFDPGGVASLAGYGSTNLFDGVRYTASTIAYAQNARWIANDSAEQYVDIGSGYFNVRSGTLVSYVLHKCSMKSYAPNSRAPTSWRIEGVLATSADDDAWVTVDEVTDFAWPGVDTSSYTYNDQEPPSSEAYASATFSVPGAKQAPYRRLRFVPTNSKMKEHNASEASKYSLMEVDFRVNDAAAGMDPGTLMVTGTPDAYGESAPGYGSTTGLSQGSEVALSIPEMVYANDEETLKAICTGWKVYTYNAATRQWDYDENDQSSHGTGNSFTYTHGSVAGKVEWQFSMQAYINVSPFGDGTVTGSGWYDVGSQATITATANGTNVFRRWEDMPEGVDGSTAEVTFTVTGPVAPKASIGGVRYVAKTGNDESNTGLSAESPFLTINHALVDLGEPGGTVYVAEGGYVETNGVDLAAMNIANEVALVGMTGRAEDVRVTTAKDGVTRHVLHLNHPRASARFMTFKGGRATSVSDGNSDSGMNVRIGAAGGAVEDCIIRDADANGWNQHGLGMFLYGGRASRCRIMNNRSTRGDTSHGGAGLGASAGIIEDCLIVSNTCGHAGAVYLQGTAVLINCTIAANTGGKYAGVYVSGSDARVVNCAILGNVANDTPEGKVYRGVTTGFINCVADLEIPDSTHCIVEEPSFRDMANGDFRPTLASACIDAGVERTAYGTVSTTDVGGSKRVVGEAVDIGCYENQKDELECGFTWSLASPMVPASVMLIGSASADGATFAWRIVNETTGAETTVPASASNTYVFETGESGVYSVTLTVSEGGDSASHTESAIFRVSPKDIYVDASSTSPEFPYDTWAKAAADVATGVGAAADGATVHVADGLYEIGAQVVVDKGIRLVGESGRPAGVVVRRTANNVRNIHVNHPDAFVANMTFENGLIGGHGGCLYLNGKGGTVSNCVFRGGRTTAHNDYYGGGVLMMAGLLTHCEITDCTSVHKDGGNLCRVLKMNGGRVSNCLIRGNVLDYTGTVVYLASGARIENCTIVDNTVKGASRVVQAQPGSTVRNCAIFAKNEEGEYAACAGDDGYASFWPRRYENCATKEMIAEYTTANGGKGWYSGINCVTNVTEEECFVNYVGGKFRPKKGGPLWNAGTNTVGVLPSVDFTGNARIYKEIIDIGCLEGIDEGLSIIVR